MKGKSFTALCMITLLTLSTIAFGAADKLAGVPSQAGPSAHLFRALWRVGGASGYSTMLLIKNRDTKNEVTANVIAFSYRGEQEAVIQLRVAPGSLSRVSLGDFIKPSGVTEHGGGLIVEFAAFSVEPVGKVVISNSQTGSSLDLPLEGDVQSDTESMLYAPWLLPDPQTDGKIMLFNSSAQAITISPSIVVESTEHGVNQVALAPHETRELRLRDLLARNDAPNEIRNAAENNIQEYPITGSVMLRCTGPPHALQPALLIENTSSGFALPPAFNARRIQRGSQPTTWVFPEVSLVSRDPGTQRMEKLKVLALVSNGSTAPVTLQGTGYFGNRANPESQSVASQDFSPQRSSLPALTLGSLETRLVDLSQLLNSSLPPSVNRIGLSISYDGLPGDVGMTIFNLYPNKNAAIKIGGAMLSQQGVRDLSYWDSRSGVGTLPRVENQSEESAQGRATLYYPTQFGVGSYTLPEIQLAGKKNEMLSLTSALRSGIPDADGNVIPSGTTSGLVTLSAAETKSTASLETATTSPDVGLRFAEAGTNACSAPPPTMSCSPSTVTRGENVTCSISSSGSGSASGWSFSDGSNTVARTNNSSALSWSGTIVKSGTVSVNFSVSGSSAVPLSANLSVNPRTSFAFTAVQPTEVTTGNTIQCGTGQAFTLISPPPPPLLGGSTTFGTPLGQSCQWPGSSATGNTIADNGPNNGYQYISRVSDQDADGVPTVFKFILVSDLRDSSSQFFRAQCGDFNAETNPGGFISGAQLRTNAFNHEAGAVFSHWTNYRNAQNIASNNVGLVIEGQTAPPGKTFGEFDMQVVSATIAAKDRIGNAVNVEPCGGRVENDSSQGCRFSGNVNFTNQTCGTQPAPTPVAFPSQLSWSFFGPIPGVVNIQWLEPADPNTWSDNYLATPIDYGFQWSFAGPIAGKQCVQINEPSDPHTWSDNYIYW